jgi:hypothetical protein
MKKIFTLLLISFCTTTLLAQPPQDENRGERIEALYVAYIRKELKLTSEEAEKFWPVHAQFDEEMKAIPKNQSTLKIQEAQLNVRKKYEPKFIKLIGSQRTDEFFKKDAAFREKLIQRLKKSGRNRSGGNNVFR